MSELETTEFAGWTMESYEQAIAHAYREGNLKGSTDKEKGKALPADYASAVKPIAERRAVLAGYRLADVLKGLF